MKKGRLKTAILGFITGLIILAIAFVITVLIMASINGRSFDQEILSWIKTENIETAKNSTNALINFIKK